MNFFENVKEFDTHISKSIPNYGILFNSIISVADYFKVSGYPIYDLGCSTGKLLNAIKHDGERIGIEYEDNIINQAVHDNIIKADLNLPYNTFKKSCLMLAVFTIQFLRHDAREPLIQSVYDSLIAGGGFIFAEKVYAETAMMQEIFTFPYYDFKAESFKYDEIMIKEKELRSILRPKTSKENVEMLRSAGFKSVSMFYKYFNFEGYICVK